jgi:hypothetical protein
MHVASIETPPSGGRARDLSFALISVRLFGIGHEVARFISGLLSEPRGHPMIRSRSSRIAVVIALFVALAMPAVVSSAVSAVPVAANGVVEIDTGAPGRAVLGNLTITGATADGWAAVYPCASGWNGTSSINYRAGADIANFIVSKSDAAGKLCVRTEQRTHVLFDQTGETDLAVEPPKRILDTRNGAPVNDVVRFATGVPNRTLIANLTATQPVADGFLATYPCLSGWSGTSTLNYGAGRTVAGAAIVLTDAQGDVCIKASARAHVIVDRIGIVAMTSNGSSRVLDTRNGTPNPADGVRRVSVGQTGRTVLGTLTITGAAGAGWAAVYPCATGWSGTSNVNVAGGDVANVFAVAADGNGEICIRSSVATHLVVDVMARPDFNVHAAERRLDTRTPTLGGAVPTLGGCSIFPADNPWNQRVDSLPVRAESDTWVTSAGRARKLHVDFGGEYGMPFIVVPAEQPMVPINFTDYGDESDPGPYPIPLNAPIEGGASSAGDRHVLVLQQGSCKLYELSTGYPKAGRWDAGSGAVFDLSSNALRPESWTSADAAGLPILPGLIRFEDIEAGALRHAIRFTVSCTQRGYIHPAVHQAGVNNTNCAPMGARFRLKAAYDISSLTGAARIIAEAMQQYGMIVADNGSNWYFQGAEDSRWNVPNLLTLQAIPGDAFDVVDTGPIIR